MSASRHVVVRQATVADAEAGARCHIACWVDAYTPIVDPDRLRALTSDVDTRIDSWRRRLSAGHTHWLAFDGYRAIGLATAGPNRDDDLHVIELYACYTRAAYWGSGLGARLLHAAIGDAAASLWVLRDNPRARSFYRKHGFVENGMCKIEPHFGIDEIRMVRSG
jgi:GNAT superfamily N-acetyltransferase